MTHRSVHSTTLTRLVPHRLPASRHARLTIFVATMTSLGIMTVLSAYLGALATLIPRVYTNYIASGLFLFFGLRLLRVRVWAARRRARLATARSTDGPSPAPLTAHCRRDTSCPTTRAQRSWRRLRRSSRPRRRLSPAKRVRWQGGRPSCDTQRNRLAPPLTCPIPRLPYFSPAPIDSGSPVFYQPGVHADGDHHVPCRVGRSLPNCHHCAWRARGGWGTRRWLASEEVQTLPSFCGPGKPPPPFFS